LSVLNEYVQRCKIAESKYEVYGVVYLVKQINSKRYTINYKYYMHGFNWLSAGKIPMQEFAETRNQRDLRGATLNVAKFVRKYNLIHASARRF
jgi:hypothetical protein